jgi:Ca2+-binding EF-hand superfamily protein
MSNLIKVIFVLVAMLALLSGNYSFAQAPSERGERLAAKFDTIDTDNDGKISHDEYMANCEERFKLLDTNNDGFLTKEEARGAAAQKREEAKQKAMEKAKMRFDQIDADKDGKISLDEWKAAHPDKPMAEEWFTAADTNGDGFLTKEEMQSSREQKRERRKGKFRRRQ